MKQISSDTGEKPQPVMSKEQVLAAQDVVRRVVVSDSVIGYATDLIRATRIRQESSPEFVRETVSWGAGPRASINLVVAAKVRAAINGRYHVGVEDI
ncbi:MAG: AAA family ATPase, partial [Opitutae bacterium]